MTRILVSVVIASIVIAFRIAAAVTATAGSVDGILTPRPFDDYDDDDVELANRYLQKYGYLQENVFDSITEKRKIEMEELLRQALALYQEIYRIAGKGELNNITLDLMKKLIRETVLKTTRVAFDTWARNSSLIFESNISHPNIMLSFRECSHVFAQPNGAACPTPLDGPVGVLAHANYPTRSADHVSEVYIDRAESWHIKINKNPSKRYSLLYILIYEIGHALRLPHSERKDSVMYAFAPERPIFPMELNLEDTLNIQQLYGGTLAATTTRPLSVTTPATRENDDDDDDDDGEDEADLCALRRINILVIINKRIFIASGRCVWSVDINVRSYQKLILITEYLKFLPENFTIFSAAYQKPSEGIVLFADNRWTKPTIAPPPESSDTIESQKKGLLQQLRDLLQRIVWLTDDSGGSNDGNLIVATTVRFLWTNESKLNDIFFFYDS
ncbi:matrix metalloproteinase-14-like [Odontomachus brunneus]|uniref:matrix metalloproteinase-14-like n=1 Tax=Odontomachus brunneus TaxID=486640 RepID=UPI0013F1EF30|nr:matrix metalloproteinase-14-like [Odontomachus brunneus]